MLPGSQLSLLGGPSSRSFPYYRPPDFPDLSFENELGFDYETDGLRWWGGNRPVGFGVAAKDGRRWYWGVGHAGGNVDRDKAREWLCSERGLAGKRVVAFKSSFEVHMSHAWGVDLEAIGCVVTDAAHSVALLDDSRRRFDLESCAERFLGEHKVTGLDKTRMAEYHAAEVEDYGSKDAWLALALRQALLRQLEAEGLMEVHALEDACIYATCEMERNGAELDVELLERWLHESERDLLATLWELHRETGIRPEPTKHKYLLELFKKYGIPVPKVFDPETKQMRDTFEDQYLKLIPHPAIKLLRRARKLISLRNKYFIPYMEDVRKNGVLRYALHQMRNDDGGTISGRFSSSELGTGDGVNIQQVAGKKMMRALRDADPILAKYNVRRLFKPRSGLLFKADAKQIEYRLFAHYAQPPMMMEAYRNDPNTDFHNFVWEMLRRIKEDISRETTKDVNFAKLFGAGVPKFAKMIGVTEKQARPIYDAYDEVFPEARRLMDEVMSKARSRGWVKTITGRRARFPGGNFLHAALNRVIQGTAADINKQKVLEVYEERKRLGLTMRFTVHDELVMDVPDEAAGAEVARILDEQSFDTNVPILWDAHTGPNWAEAA